VVKVYVSSSEVGIDVCLFFLLFLSYV